MGLDIYVRWGNVADNYDDDYKYFTEWSGKNPEYKYYYNAQMTGYRPAPESGYLRESWGSLRWVRDMAEKYDAPYPYYFWPDWNGFNGEQLDLTSGNRLSDVLAFRDEVLIPWLGGSYDKWESLDTEDRGDFDEFVVRVRNVIGFINFVQCHRDKPNLTIIFG